MIRRVGMVWLPICLDLVAQGEVGAGVSGPDAGQVLAELADRGGGSAGGERVEADGEGVVVGDDVSGLLQGLADQGVGFVVCAGVTDSIAKRREAGKDLGGRPRRITDSQIRNALRLVESGEPAAQAARDLGMSRATFYRRSNTLEP